MARAARLGALAVPLSISAALGALSVRFTMSPQSLMLAAGLRFADEAGVNAGVGLIGRGALNTAFYGSKAGHKLPAPVVGITVAR